VQRAAIVTLWLNDVDRNTIAQRIPCHLNTVGHWIQAWQQRRDLADAERSGRPRITTESTDRRIEEFAEEKKFTTPREIQNELELDVSARTIRRRLDEVGLYGRVARTEHDYTELDLRRRIAFAEGYKHWSEADWERVIFSDETHFDRFGHGHPWVQRPIGMAFDSAYLAHGTQQFESVGLWACFCAKGIGQAEIYVGEYKSEQYCSMLYANLLATARAFYPRQHWYLLHDNAPQHSSLHTAIWLHNHGVTVIDFPPYSPDLNPIENLFFTLKQRVYAHFPHTAADIEAALHVEWEALPTDLLRTLAHSMPARLNAAINNKGHKTKY
jgi:transposase